MADTVAVMNKGHIEQMGAPAELYDLPRTQFVANFLGQANNIDGSVTGRDGDSVIFEGGGRKFAAPASRSQVERGPGCYGIRPEKLRLHESPQPERAGQQQLGPGRLVDVSFTGVSTQYLVDIPGFPTFAVFEQNLDVDPVHNRPGDEVYLTWESGHAFVVQPSDSPA